MKEPTLNSEGKPRLNKNIGNCPIKKCKHRGCKKNGIAYCIFANNGKGEQPKFSGYLCEEHFNKYHKMYCVGG